MESTRFEPRLNSIELRLTRIEGSLKASGLLPHAEQERPAPQQPPTPRPRPATEAWSQLPPETPDKPGNWLGIIAVICFVMAAGLIIKLSIDSGWLTPPRQLALAGLLGLSLIGAGLSLMRKDREYASLLPGAGIIVLDLTTFAAHLYYGLIPYETALGLTTLISGICIWLYTKIKHDVYPITAALGAYIAPMLFGFQTNTMFTMDYFLICSIAFAAISISLQTRTLMMVSAYLALAMMSWIGVELHQNGLVASLLGLQFFIFAANAWFYTYQNRTPLSENEAWCLLPVLLLFYAVEYYLIDQIQPGLAPWIALAFSGVLIGLTLTIKRNFPDSLGSQTLLLAFISLIIFHAGYLKLLPGDVRPWLFVVIVAGGSFFPLHRLRHKEARNVLPPLVAILAIVAIEYLSLVRHLSDTPTTACLIVAFAALGSLWLLLARNVPGVSSRDVAGNILLGAAHFLALLAFYQLTTDVGALAVSASWLFYAVAVMVFAFLRKDEIMAKSALFVLGFAAGKALLYDAAAAPTLVRILCLMLTGAVLYGCGFFMRKVSTWTPAPTP